jgi:tetratricopeptide (TPR) repeat protein
MPCAAPARKPGSLAETSPFPALPVAPCGHRLMRLPSPALLLALLAACASAPREPGPGTTSEGRPALPSPPGPLAPSEARIAAGAKIADVGSCEACHADVAAMWRTSAHAFASFNNPAYRVSVDRFRAEAGAQPSRHCAGCHDVAALADGVMDRPLGAREPAPPLDPADPRARAGVTCRTCHGIEETRPDGNGSYTLAARAIPIPTEGDAESVRRHKEAAAPAPLRTEALCASCHRAFLGPETGNPHHLAGADDMTPWQRSVYAGSRLARVDDDGIPEQGCKTCHMPREAAPRGDAAAKDGKVASHRFLGGHTWLAAMRRDDDQLGRARGMLEGAASIDVAAVIHPRDGSRSLPADGAPVLPGEPLVLDVVVRNQRVGHQFPGGTLDAQDTWVEVTVDDARGRRVAEAGTQHEATGDDPTAHVLRALLAGAGGAPLLGREVNRFHAAVINSTTPPRDAAVVELAFDAPDRLDDGALPLRVTARLRHRSRTLELQRAACADATTTAWGRASAAIDGLDPCAPQPITEIARAEVLLGNDGGTAPRRPTWRRLVDHAYGLSHAVQERLDEARPSLARALAEVEATGSPRDQAEVLAALAHLEAYEGRTDEALRVLARAEALLPGHPALASLRGEALSQVWRWTDAVGPLDEAARAAPRDDAAWARLALALGSRGGDDRATLDAAARGLALQPRDPDLLRLEALALGALGDARAPAARRAYDAFRPADAIPRVRAACSARVPGCALERSPVHVHRMRQVMAIAGAPLVADDARTRPALLVVPGRERSGWSR